MNNEKYYAILGKRVIREKFALEIRNRSRIAYKKQLEQIAINNGTDIKALYKATTEATIDSMVEEGLLWTSYE